jgi:hypothetical protein
MTALIALHPCCGGIAGVCLPQPGTDEPVKNWRAYHEERGEKIEEAEYESLVATKRFGCHCNQKAAR